jgi:hypothetical protein
MKGDSAAEDSNRPDDSVDASKPLFSARTSTLFRMALVGATGLVAGSGFVASAYFHSDNWNGVGFAPMQPVPFSHQLHAGELRMDCRNCHATAETSAFAGLPATETCLACHSQLLTATPSLQPVMTSDARRMPLQWNRVTRLPDHVYFNHSIHVSKGVSCLSCHGEVGKMAVLAQREPLTMRWCIDCHRNPGPRLRRSGEIFDATTPTSRSGPPPAELLRSYQVHTENLTNCSTCHH